jgi:hypothetical protein
VRQTPLEQLKLFGSDSFQSKTDLIIELLLKFVLRIFFIIFFMSFAFYVWTENTSAQVAFGYSPPGGDYGLDIGDPRSLRIPF